MKKTLKELIIKELLDKYDNKKILKNRLRKKSKLDVYYAICLNNKDVVHVYNSIYIEELKTFLRNDMTSLCDSKFTDIREMAVGLMEKEVKHILCLLDADNVKVCSECVKNMYE